MLNRRKIVKGVLVEVGFVTLFIVVLFSLSWLV